MRQLFQFKITLDLRNIMKKNMMICCLLAINSSWVFGTALTSMSKEQIKQNIINKTFTSIPTDNLNGKTIDNTFSMFMDNDGKVYGKMSHKPTDEPQTDAGIYSISKDGTVYFTWQHWDGAKKLCFNVFQTQNTYLSIGCDHVFHTAFMKADVQNGNHL